MGRAGAGSNIRLTIDDLRRGLGADIDANMIEFHGLPFVVYNDDRSPDPEPSPTRLVNPGTWTLDSPRYW